MLRVAERFEKTDTGRQRRVNEDAYFARAPLFVVADGMGGAQAGEVASRTAVAEFEPELELDGGQPEQALADRARAANTRIHELSRESAEHAGMGTTLTAVYVGADEISIAHVGDSRAYVLRDGELHKLTDDHSLVDELVKRGELTPAEAQEHPQRSVITRALGPEPSVEVDTVTFKARAGDVYLLCSDGLTGMVPVEAIAAILAQSATLREAGQALVAAANRAGGKDNITVVLFRLEDVEAAASAASQAAVDQPTTSAAAGPAAEQDGFEATASGASGARAAVASPRARSARADAPTAATQTAARPPRSPRRPAPVRRRRVRRLVGPAIALALVAAIIAGAWVASQSVYFLGTNNEGLVTMYQGVPYELPLGLKLYSSDYVSGVPAVSLAPARRRALLDHSLRSHDDAADLLRKLELGQLEAAP